ncbi:alpha-galactosidase A, putative [Eimeria maxima]|uniref:Alpha-galactosidase A, putative n=1 Tax=Eimeria maxima TaxID=5804 RepID=U6MBN9_EIMMA|nr:alpha-galactosidase A, putative [Eimeria maxima]CDJ61617.1 alpha-galactosidase A, putative [Eimeria maxima]
MFPNSVQSIAQFASTKGVLFGLGLTVSSEDCPELQPSPDGLTASEFLEEAAQWGVDFVKLNSCSRTREEAAEEFAMWAEAAKTSAPSLLLFCSWSRKHVAAEELGQLCSEWEESERIHGSHGSHGSHRESSAHAAGGSNVHLQVVREEKEKAVGASNDLHHGEGSDHHKLELDISSGVAKRERRLASAALLGRHVTMRVSSFDDFLQQAELIEDPVWLAAVSDPQEARVKSNRGDGGLEVLTRQQADGDCLLGLFNRGEQQLSVAAAAAQVLQWCGVEGQSLSKITQAWTHLSSQHQHQQQQEQQQQQIDNLLLPPDAAALMLVEMADPLLSLDNSVACYANMLL